MNAGINYLRNSTSEVGTNRGMNAGINYLRNSTSQVGTNTGNECWDKLPQELNLRGRC